MDILVSNYVRLGWKNFWLGVLLAFTCLLFFILGLKVSVPVLVVFAGFAISSYIAFFFPTVTVVAILITGVIPTVFQMTPIFSEDYGLVALGFHAPDLVLLSMAGAVLLQLLRRKRVVRGSLGVCAFILCFALWLFFEILRNFGSYGLSAPGEFRYRYLILILPLYIALFFPLAMKRSRLLKVLLLSSVLIPLACVPVIGQLKGWAYGAESRFFPAELSLGLLYGLISIFFAHKCRMLKLSAAAVWLIAIPLLFLVLVDGHRSVWLAAIASVVVAFLLGEVSIARTVRLMIPLIVLAAVVTLAVSRVGINIADYVSSRAIAFTNYEMDDDARWRAAIWGASMDKILASPLTGEGFGGYWYVTLPELGQLVTVSPHNLYVQSLVKIGAIGLGLYAIIMFKLGRSLMKALRRLDSRREKEYALLATALVVLISSHAFYIAYAFEYYTWLFVGLGAAALRDIGGSRVQTKTL
jgi:O-antigen ligase